MPYNGSKKMLMSQVAKDIEKAKFLLLLIDLQLKCKLSKLVYMFER
jgi:hypothetical protein